jgi:hypothetical protein
MFTYKLKYTDKESAIKDLLEKKVLIETLLYNTNTISIVEVGAKLLKEATYDENFKEITKAEFKNEYLLDIMSLKKIDFSKNEIFPIKPIHTFEI